MHTVCTVLNIFILICASRKLAKKRVTNTTKNAKKIAFKKMKNAAEQLFLLDGKMLL